MLRLLSSTQIQKGGEGHEAFDIRGCASDVVAGLLNYAKN
jgi:hypothetical protein